MGKRSTWWINYECPFRGVFNYVALIFPYENNETYRGFARGDPRLFALPTNQDDVEDRLEDCETLFLGTNTLIILDDCAVSTDVKKRSGKLVDLGFSGRHVGLSVWVLTQQLTSICKPFRDNVACVIAFHNPSQTGTRTMFEEFGGALSLEERKERTKCLKEERYSRLCFCLRYPFQCYLEIV